MEAGAAYTGAGTSVLGGGGWAGGGKRGEDCCGLGGTVFMAFKSWPVLVEGGAGEAARLGMNGLSSEATSWVPWPGLGRFVSAAS